MRDTLARVACPDAPRVVLTIDNGDGARDYTAALDPETPLRVHRMLNAPSRAEFALRLRDPGLVVPVAGATVRIARSDGSILFIGTTDSEPAYELLGWGEAGPVYRLALAASGEEKALDEYAAPVGRVLHDVGAGTALKQMAADIAGPELDCGGVTELDKVHSLEIVRRRKWTEQAADLAAQARAAYRVEDGKVWLDPIGARSHQVSENDADFEPDALTLRIAAPLASDVTVVGDREAASYVKDYFVGDGARTTFALSHAPFTHAQQMLLRDDFTTLDPLRWRIQDPASALSCAGGQLVINGDGGAGNETAMSAIGRLQLGGVLIVQHGTVVFAGACEGVIGGLYASEASQAGCIAGFLVSTAEGEVSITALLNGATAGDPFTVVEGHAYTLRTRLYCAEYERARQVWHSSKHPAGSPLGGDPVPAKLRVVLEVGDIDLSQPVTAPEWTVLYEQSLENAPAFADYALMNVGTMHAQIAQLRAWRAPEVELECAPAGEASHTEMIGAMRDGGQARLQPGAMLQFSGDAAPGIDEQITVRYRTSQVAAGRVFAPDAGQARAMVCRVAAPQAATSEECALAAEALLDDVAQPRCSGEYSTWSDKFADVRPGDAVHLDVPSREADVDVIVREVWLEPQGDGRCRARFKFANEAESPIAIRTAEALHDPDSLDATEKGAQPCVIASLANAEITTFATGMIGVDAGQEPVEGGGFEIRRSDGGWGSDAGLILRADSREFILERTSRVADYYLRAFDGSTPRRYSRFTTVLHVDYPL